MENNLVNVEQFLERRPDMEVHTDVSIQSAINSAYILLDGECAGLISLVDKYMSGSDIDTKNDLYRNTFEMTQLKEAIIFQTQYILNMGNDFSVGGGSYSIGNVNGSFNRPEGREAVAPGVYKLLSNARVYNLNYGIGIKTNDNSGCCERMDDAPISQESADLRYVRVQQQEAEVGSVAYVNQSNQVAFGNPQDLNITSYNTNRIEGGVGHKGNYYEIDNVPNIAFFGKDLNGTYSAVHRGEIQDILDNWIESIDIHILDGLTKQEIYDAIVAAGGVWSPLIKYSQGFIVIFPLDNVNAKKVKSTSGFYGFAKSLQNNNLNNNPNNSPDYWEILPATPTDLVALQEYIKDYIDNTILPILQNETIPNEVEKQIAEKSENFNVEFAGELIGFENDADKELWEQATGAKLTPYEPQFIQDIEDLKSTKQDTLTAGDGIDITGNSISVNNKIATKEEVKTKLQINNLPNTLNYYYKEVSLPSNNLQNATIYSNIDKTKIVSINVWIERDLNSNIWFLISGNENGNLPFTVEGGGTRLEMWRLAPTDNNKWRKARIHIIYNGVLN